jgi:hypothetical protein
MTESDPQPSDTQQDVELSRVEAQLSELLREAYELRAELKNAGPMDQEERASIITQAEELEGLAAEQDTGQAAAAQVAEELGPELLGFAVPDRAAEDFAVAVGAGAGGDHDRLGHDPAVDPALQ